MEIERLADGIRIDRFPENPLITPDSGPVGGNINGPSVIRAPPWVDDPLGRYYLYFAHHRGEFIRLAHADDLRGPWAVHEPGVLDLTGTRFSHHIASPDVHVDRETGRVRMYFHGCCGQFEVDGDATRQATSVAFSSDGLAFDTRDRVLGYPYFRVWEHGGALYAVANDGFLYRAEAAAGPFDRQHELFPRNRHFAVRRIDADVLQVFLTRRGDRPERLMVAHVDLSEPHGQWRPEPHPPETVLWPEEEYEGGALPLSTSEGGPVDRPVRALRDPAVFEEDDRTYLFYAIAGEHGIAGAEVRERATHD